MKLGNNEVVVFNYKDYNIHTSIFNSDTYDTFLSKSWSVGSAPSIQDSSVFTPSQRLASVRSDRTGC